MGQRIDLATPLSKRCDWLEIVPSVRSGARMFTVREKTLYTENSISLRQRYRIINLSKTYERYIYRY